jgi:hypothetical protein
MVPRAGLNDRRSTIVCCEVLVSSMLRQLVDCGGGAATFGEQREVELKGLSGTYAIFAVQVV